MGIEENKSLRSYNTFGIECRAKYFASVQNQSDLIKLLDNKVHDSVFILGGGSNILLSEEIDALVIHIGFKGIKILERDDHLVRLEVMAGENWNDFVNYCVNNGFGGVENLSLIPGNVGAAPIQNIGAYGVELEEVFVSCEAIDKESLDVVTFSRSDCKFGYRNSIFKQEAKGKYIITKVILELTTANHKINAGYGAIKDLLKERGIDDPGIRDISEVVIEIRRSKLPDPAKLGNSGSFFKNPVVNSETFTNLRARYPEIPFYEVTPTTYKIPAGWLIERAGFKGIREGDAGVHKNQALVLVNYGNATGTEIWNLAQNIQQKIKEEFGIFLEPEVTVI